MLLGLAPVEHMQNPQRLLSKCSGAARCCCASWEKMGLEDAQENSQAQEFFYKGLLGGEGSQWQVG